MGFFDDNFGSGGGPNTGGGSDDGGGSDSGADPADFVNTDPGGSSGGSDSGGGGGGGQSEGEAAAPSVSDAGGDGGGGGGGAGGGRGGGSSGGGSSGGGSSGGGGGGVPSFDLGGGGGGGSDGGGGGGGNNQTEAEAAAPDVSDPGPSVAEPRIGDKISATERQQTSASQPLRSVDRNFIDRQTGSGGVFAETPTDTSGLLPGSVAGVDISEQQLDQLADAGEQAGDELADTASGGRQMPRGTVGSPLNSAFGREVADAGGRAIEEAASIPQQAETAAEFVQNAPLNAETVGTVGATATGAVKGFAESAVTEPVDFAADIGVGAVTGTAALRGTRAARSALPDRDSLTPDRSLSDRSIQDLRGSNRGQIDPASVTQTVSKTETRDTTDFETVQTSDELTTTQTQQLLQERRIANQLNEQTDKSDVLARSEQLDESTTPQTQQTLAERRDVGPAQQTAAHRTQVQTDVLDFDQQARAVVDDTTTGAAQTAGVVGGVASTLTATQTAGPSSDTLAPLQLSEETATETPPIVNQLAPTTTQTAPATATATSTQTRTATEQTTATPISTLLSQQTPTQTSTQNEPDLPDKDGDEPPREREPGVLEGERGRFNFLNLQEADNRVADVLDGGEGVL